MLSRFAVMIEIEVPSVEVCERARASKDPRFDGLFFTAVRSTGIYCRPTCPAPTVKRENALYFPTAAAAAAAGYRPCLRCRPELAPEMRFRGNETAMQRALALIADGALENGSIEALASQVGLSARQLRRLFVTNMGATPMAVHATRRLLLAKQLLTETSMPVTQVALAAGFRSLRRFNAVFRNTCGIAPSAIRHKEIPNRSQDTFTLRLAYQPPLEFQKILEFLARRSIPGIERITSTTYERAIGSADETSFIKVTSCDSKPELLLEISGTDPRKIPEIVRRVRRLFDLDADLHAAHQVLKNDPILPECIARNPGLRVPGAWDPFELIVRAVLGQQVTVAGASTLARRLVEKFGMMRSKSVAGLDRIFPSPEQLIHAPLETIGMPKSRAITLRAVAAAVWNGQLKFSAGQRLDSFIKQAIALPGIGLWTAHYVAMRALNHPDAFPAGDLILRRILGGEKPLTGRQCETRSLSWRPWRAYAVLHLWNLATSAK